MDLVWKSKKGKIRALGRSDKALVIVKEGDDYITKAELNPGNWVTIDLFYDLDEAKACLDEWDRQELQAKIEMLERRLKRQEEAAQNEAERRYLCQAVPESIIKLAQMMAKADALTSYMMGATLDVRLSAWKPLILDLAKRPDIHKFRKEVKKQ